MSDTTAGAANAAEEASARERMLKAGRLAWGVTGTAAKSAADFAYRSALPLMALYAAKSVDDGQDGGDASDDEVRKRNRAIANAAGTKALLELVEIASVTHPLYDGATPYAYSSDGRAAAPHMRHILSLALAAQSLFERVKQDDPKGEQGSDVGGTDGNPAIPPDQRVAFIAVAPGEYQYVSGPLSPTAIRRSAMRERSYGQPALATLAYRQNAFSAIAANAPQGGQSALAAPMTAQQYGRQALAARRTSAARGGCGCGGSGSCGCAGRCGCGGGASCGCGGGGGYAFPPARRNEDGECASLFQISCETKWRLRECFKQSLCDLLRCLGEELCEDGQIATGTKPDLGKCLEGFVCSLVDCLPEAICPPPPPSTVCITQEPRDCDCNFAVGS